jgi:hypothetical protein
MWVVQSSQVGCTNKDGLIKNSHDSVCVCVCVCVCKQSHFQSKANSASQLSCVRRTKAFFVLLTEKSIL